MRLIDGGVVWDAALLAETWYKTCCIWKGFWLQPMDSELVRCEPCSTEMVLGEYFCLTTYTEDSEGAKRSWNGEMLQVRFRGTLSEGDTVTWDTEECSPLALFSTQPTFPSVAWTCWALAVCAGIQGWWSEHQEMQQSGWSVMGMWQDPACAGTAVPEGRDLKALGFCVQGERQITGINRRGVRKHGYTISCLMQILRLLVRGI